MGETRDALTLALMSIDVKIKTAKHNASQFESNNLISNYVKDSYTRAIIPCLTDIRNELRHWIDTSKDLEELNPTEALMLLATGIMVRSKEFENFKSETNLPSELATLDLCAGVYSDLSQEILEQIEWHQKNQNEKSLQTNQETQIKETSEELNKPNLQQVQPSVVETFPTPVQNNQQNIAPSNLEPPISTAKNQAQTQKTDFSGLWITLTVILVAFVAVIGVTKNESELRNKEDQFNLNESELRNKEDQFNLNELNDKQKDIFYISGRPKCFDQNNCSITLQIDGQLHQLIFPIQWTEYISKSSHVELTYSLKQNRVLCVRPSLSERAVECI